MMPITTVELQTNVLVPLATAAVRVLVLAGIAGIGLAAFRVRSTSVRLFTWTAMLYVALAMPFLQRMLPPLPVPIASLLQARTEQAIADTGNISQPVVLPPATHDSVLHQQSTLVETKAPASPRRSGPAIRWNAVAVGIYLSVVLFLLARLVVGLALGYRLRRVSRIIREAGFAMRFADRARGARLSSLPLAAESELISVPVTMGVVRPVVFFPSTWRDWDAAKLDAVIAHELSHVARRDTLTLRLSFLHCTIFWFSPMAWWLHRELADLVEQASDEAALAGGVDCQSYARTLLDFFEALQGAPQRVWWQGVSMASAGRAEQRVERILESKGAVVMSLKKSIVILVVLLAIPVVFLTAAAQPPDRTLNTSGELAQNKATPAIPPASHGARASKKSSSHSFYSYSDDDALPYVIVSGKTDTLTMSGNHMDSEHIEDLRKTISGDFIWFRGSGKSYIIRDQGTIDRARALWAPQEELGKKQEELGKQQEELGKQQEELGMQMEQVQVKVPDLTNDLEKLQAKLKELNSGATSDQIAEIQSQIGELQEKIGDVQSQAGDRQSKLGDQMGALGEKQGRLGEQQGELGRQQGELAEKASRQMKKLLEESVTKGTAQLEN
ncbi:MAG: hypothetical protein HY010_06500 [Acidobacteria bacterium]|nr:hypothetical protein [Acidobacteriota bacterium]